MLDVIGKKPNILQIEIGMAIEKIQELSPQLKKDKLCLETIEWLDKCRKVKTFKSSVEQDRLVFEGLALADLWEKFRNNSLGVFRYAPEEEIKMTPFLKSIGIHSAQRRLILHKKSEVILNALHEYSLRYSESIKDKSLTDKVETVRQGHGLYTVLERCERKPKLEIIAGGRRVRPQIPDDFENLAAMIDPTSYGYLVQEEKDFYREEIPADPFEFEQLIQEADRRLHDKGIESPAVLPTIQDLKNEGLVRAMFYSGRIDPRLPVLQSKYDPAEEMVLLSIPNIQLS